MPTTYTYPGVYVEEIPSGVRTITGVSTSDTAFVGFFKKGPMKEPVRITSYADFERRFGGLDRRSDASYAIQQYYLNGGQVAWVVRVATDGSPEDLSSADLELAWGSPEEGTSLTITAASEGAWGDRLGVKVQSIAGKPLLFNLLVQEIDESGAEINLETFLNLSMDPNSSRYVKSVVDEESSLVRVEDYGVPGGDVPYETGEDFVFLSGGGDGDVPGLDELEAGWVELEKIAPFVFNILCVPAGANLYDEAGGTPADKYAVVKSVYEKAEAFCKDNRAFLIVDIPERIDVVDEMWQDWLDLAGSGLTENAAVYFPRLKIADGLNENRPKNVGASGTMAGVFARTDSTRGVWKAPAGTDAGLRGANLITKLTDLENGALNPLGLNVLRNFPIFGNVAWGARTMNGADQEASEWKYIPVRRTALYIEESLYQGLKWVVFEPNDERLWSQIRLNVGAFMQNLFRQGAFQGTSPREAYFVKCDSETTTQNDINLGVVNIRVGFAPLKPAEFVVIKIQQIAGQVEA